MLLNFISYRMCIHNMHTLKNINTIIEIVSKKCNAYLIHKLNVYKNIYLLYPLSDGLSN